jgi:hypothetical protein
MAKLLTKQEVAANLRISRRKLDYLFARGEGPNRTFIGKRVRVTEPHYEQWLAECAERHESPVDAEQHDAPFDRNTNRPAR